MRYQVPRDEAEKRRMRLERVEWIMWTVLGILEFLLGLRLVINLFSANLDNGFKIFIFGVTKVIIAPFGSLLGMPAFEGSVFEMTTLVAMAAYALIFWIIISLNGSVMARVEQNNQEAVNVAVEPSSSQLPETVLQATIFQDDERQE